MTQISPDCPSSDDSESAPVEKKLECAQAHLAQARHEEAVAEREVADAIHDVEEAARHEVMVHVVHVNEVEKTSFEQPLDATLQQVWDQSYKELKIARNSKDIFQTGGAHPKSLMNDLNLTLAEAREHKVITAFHFGIASETGGA